MKAIVKATGEYIEVEQRGPTFLNTNDGSLYNVEELDLNVVDDMMSEQEKWYWKDKHIQAAIAAMQTVDDHVSTVDELAERCVRYADALIKELQKNM